MWIGDAARRREEFLNHYKNDLNTHAHTPSGGFAGAELIGDAAKRNSE